RRIGGRGCLMKYKSPRRSSPAVEFCALEPRRLLTSYFQVAATAINNVVVDAAGRHFTATVTISDLTGNPFYGRFNLDVRLSKDTVAGNEDDRPAYYNEALSGYVRSKGAEFPPPFTQDIFGSIPASA